MYNQKKYNAGYIPPKSVKPQNSTEQRGFNPPKSTSPKPTSPQR